MHETDGRRSLLAAGVVLALAGLLSAGCAALPLAPSVASGGALAATADLRGAEYVVAGGESDELELLCQLTVAALQAAGARAQEQCDKIGSVDVRVPQDTSEVDTGWAYVGRADRNLDDRADPPASFADLARADAAQGVTWLAPSAFADTDAVVVSPRAAASGIRTLSDLAARARTDPRVTLCATAEAAQAPESLAGVLATYPFPPTTTVRVVDAGAELVDVARDAGCSAGVVPGTSGRIPAVGLTVLADDRGGFGRGVDGRPGPGRGGAAPVLRSEVVARHPQVAAVLGTLTTRLTDDTVRELNRAVAVDGRDPREVARRWLRDLGLIDRG